ncbi:MAG: SBBP repeat-containing protein, partial [Methanoregulaceae archaeon]|nr:SBBP repeat-containing protein [Methanoregulaceae archaeon]
MPVSGFLGFAVAADLPDPALASGTGDISLPLVAEAAASVESSGEQAVPSTGIPLFFIGNKGQTSDDILFEVITGGGILFYTKDGSSISLIGEGRDYPSPVLEYSFEGTSGGLVVEGFDKLPCRVNFLKSPDPASWVTGAETYRGIRYKDLYPGIDLKIEGVEQGIKSTYHVEPGADTSAIRIRYSGQDNLSLNKNGNLEIRTGTGVLEETAPFCYQMSDGRRVEVPSSFIIEDDTIGFEVGEYDREKELVIDPTLVFGLYLNGTGFQEANGVALDPDRNIYVTGKSFPVPYDPGNATAGYSDAVVAKINPEGTLPVYVTFIGGSGADSGQGIRVDEDGYAYVTGITNSSNFPIVNPVQPALAGQNDAFVTKLSQDGSIVYSTYLGGRNQDSGMAIALDSARNAYITGGAGAAFSPVPTISQNSTFTGLGDAYIAKISSGGSTLVYLEYVGGRVIETGYGIDVDNQGNAYITGETFSWSGFPIVNAYQPVFGGYSDAFVTKVGRYGYPLLYSTYLGGSDLDAARAIDVDSEGYAHITGLTWSQNLPTTVNAYHRNTLGAINSFYSVLGPAGNSLNYSTYLTGPGVDEGRGIAITPQGSVYITGITKAPKLATLNAIQPTYGGGVSDAFVAKFVKGQPIPEYLTYL